MLSTVSPATIAQKTLSVFFFILLMVKSRKKRIKERKETRTFYFVLTLSLLILAGILAFSNYKIKRETAELAEEKESLAKRVEELKKKKEDLEKGLSESERSIYWEERIREQGYKKPGENVVVIKKPDDQGPSSATKEKTRDFKGFWQNLLAQIRVLLDKNNK